MSSNKNQLIDQQLLNIKSDLPSAQILSEQQKSELCSAVGIGTIKNIVKAKSSLPIERIPFLFSSIDSQIVLDILANDWEDFLRNSSKKK